MTNSSNPPPPTKPSPSRAPGAPRPISLPPKRDFADRPKTGSGEHPAVKKFRDKLQSIAEHTLPEFTSDPKDPPK